MTLNRGWKARQEAAKAKLAAGIPQQLADNLKVASDRLQAEREAAAAHQAEIARIRSETACPCPSCDGGRKVLTVDEAAFIASAVAYYKGHAYATDPAQIRLQNQRIANPEGVVVGMQVIDPRAYDNSASLSDHLVAQVIAVDEAQTDDEAVSQAQGVEAKKPTRRHVVPPHLSDD